MAKSKRAWLSFLYQEHRLGKEKKQGERLEKKGDSLRRDSSLITIAARSNATGSMTEAADTFEPIQSLGLNIHFP